MLAPEKFQVTDLKVAPVVAQVPPIAASVVVSHAEPAQQPPERPRLPSGIDHGIPHWGGGNLLLNPEVVDYAKQAGARLANLPEGDREAVGLSVASHLHKWVVGDGARVLDSRL